VWLEINVERSPASSIAGVLEGADFRVFDALVGINARARDSAARIDNHGADVGIR
jgi:hypothetical protein